MPEETPVTPKRKRQLEAIAALLRKADQLARPLFRAQMAEWAAADAAAEAAASEPQSDTDIK